ncbi:hypothetical protein TNCV_1111521 [Trichonephila clavipes]|nr:hypothetical protein TNCV_1111521 [Trichonephila clavipes]
MFELSTDLTYMVKGSNSGHVSHESATLTTRLSRAPHIDEVMKSGVSNMNLKQNDKVRNEVRKSTASQRTWKIPSKIKTMLITFFDARGIIHKEFVPTVR